MPTDTLNPVAYVEAVRQAGGHLWPHDNLNGFIMWTPTKDVSQFLLELRDNMIAGTDRDRAIVTCYLAEHPSKCDRPPFCPG